MNLYIDFEYYGAHPINNTQWIFRVFAPGAKTVAIKGDFTNNTPINMALNRQGVWEIIHSAKEYQKYQYIITTNNNDTYIKVDPYSFLTQDNYALIFNFHKLKLNIPKINIQNEMKQHPLNIYEIFLGGWSDKYKTYRDIAEPLTKHLNDYGYNAVQFMPLTEYKTDDSWGYQPVSFFAPTQRYGNPEDLIYLIDYLHQHNIYVFLDWTPAHFDNCNYGLKNFDGCKMYEYTQLQYEEHPIWKTKLFDWGNPYIESFLISSANFWLSVYGFDGLRVDTVTTLIQLFELNNNYEVTSVYYNQEGLHFCHNLTHFIKQAHPNAILIAEETQGFQDITNPNIFNFSYKQALGWSWDTGTFINMAPGENDKFFGLTRPLDYAYLNNNVLTYGHDQIAKQNGFLLQQFHLSYEQVKTFLTYMIAFPGKKCLFMGNEYGQAGYWGYDRPLKGPTNKAQEEFSDYIKQLNILYLNTPALYEKDFEPIGTEVIVNNNEDKVLAIIRHGSNQSVLCVCNFSDKDYINYGMENTNNYTSLIPILYTNHEIEVYTQNNKIYLQTLPAHSAHIFELK